MTAYMRRLSETGLHAAAHLHGWEDLLEGPYHPDTERLERAGEGIPTERVDQTAIPSYTHSSVVLRSLFEARGNAVMQWIGGRSPDVLLDAGCGAGILIEGVKKESDTEALGIDLIPEVSRRYLNGDDGSGVLRAALSTLPLRDGAVESIVAMDVLEHIDELGGVLEEFERVLVPGGQLVVSGPTENFVYRVGRRLVGFSGEYHATDIYQVERAIAAASFSRRRNRKISLGLPLFSITEYRVDE